MNSPRPENRTSEGGGRGGEDGGASRVSRASARERYSSRNSMGMNSLEEGAALDTGSLEAGVVGERVSLTEGSISRPKSPQPPRPPSPRPTPPTTRRLLAAGGEPPASTRLTDVNQLGVKQVGRTGKLKMVDRSSLAPMAVSTTLAKKALKEASPRATLPASATGSKPTEVAAGSSRRGATDESDDSAATIPPEGGGGRNSSSPKLYSWTSPGPDTTDEDAKSSKPSAATTTVPTTPSSASSVASSSTVTLDGPQPTSSSNAPSASHSNPPAAMPAATADDVPLASTPAPAKPKAAPDTVPDDGQPQAATAPATEEASLAFPARRPSANLSPPKPPAAAPTASSAPAERLASADLSDMPSQATPSSAAAAPAQQVPAPITTEAQIGSEQTELSGTGAPSVAEAFGSFFGNLFGRDATSEVSAPTTAGDTSAAAEKALAPSNSLAPMVASASTLSMPPVAAPTPALVSTQLFVAGASSGAVARSTSELWPAPAEQAAATGDSSTRQQRLPSRHGSKKAVADEPKLALDSRTSGDGSFNEGKASDRQGSSRQASYRRAANAAASRISSTMNSVFGGSSHRSSGTRRSMSDSGSFADAATTRASLDEILTFRGTIKSRTPEKSSMRAMREDPEVTYNPTCLEMYLNDDEFSKVFGMSKDGFYKLRQWKQREMKKKAGLF